MDYRELENRLARNRELISERKYDRLVEEAKRAYRTPRKNWWGRLYAILRRRSQRGDDLQMPLRVHPVRPFEQPSPVRGFAVSHTVGLVGRCQPI